VPPVVNVSPAIPLPDVLSIFDPGLVPSVPPDIPLSVPYWSVPVPVSVWLLESLHANIMHVKPDNNATLKNAAFFMIKLV
jgi:hypothetical protein